MSRLATIFIDELTRATQHELHHEGSRSGILLRRAQAHAEAHIDSPLSVEDLAASAGCSEASMYRAFREHLRTSPGRWLASFRADRASVILRTTTLSVRKVGELVGYVDPFHFSRLFKREMGASPQAYRNSKRIL
jgi:transcriptional regulator GlxA family with amidase domain